MMPVGITAVIEQAPSVPVNFIILVTFYVRLQEEEPQTAFAMSFTWASDIGRSPLTGR